jgi:hypothetical protein
MRLIFAFSFSERLNELNAKYGITAFGIAQTRMGLNVEWYGTLVNPKLPNNEFTLYRTK